MFILWWEEPLVGESTGGEMKKFLANGWNLSNKYTVLNLKFLVQESEREGICNKWWDQQLYDNTHLISHNKYLECYLQIAKIKLNDN